MSVHAERPSSHHLHRDLAQAVDAKQRALAPRDRDRRDQASSNHDHAGFKIAPAVGKQIGKPGECGSGVFRRTRNIYYLISDT